MFSMRRVILMKLKKKKLDAINEAKLKKKAKKQTPISHC